MSGVCPRAQRARRALRTDPSPAAAGPGASQPGHALQEAAGRRQALHSQQAAQQRHRSGHVQAQEVQRCATPVSTCQQPGSPASSLLPRPICCLLARAGARLPSVRRADEVRKHASSTPGRGSERVRATLEHEAGATCTVEVYQLTRGDEHLVLASQGLLDEVGRSGRLGMPQLRCSVRTRPWPPVHAHTGAVPSGHGAATRGGSAQGGRAPPTAPPTAPQVDPAEAAMLGHYFSSGKMAQLQQALCIAGLLPALGSGSRPSSRQVRACSVTGTATGTARCRSAAATTPSVRRLLTAQRPRPCRTSALPSRRPRPPRGPPPPGRPTWPRCWCSGA
jgi:hypothetical protein